MSNVAPTYTEFIAVYPIFIPPAVNEVNVQYQLDFAARLLSKLAWGDWYSDGIMLMVAHNISLWLKSQSSIEGGTQAATGNVSSTSGAGLSISFESANIGVSPGSKSGAYYNKTIYGQQLLYLQSIVINSAELTA